MLLLQCQSGAVHVYISKVFGNTSKVVLQFQVSFHPSGNFLASSSLDGSIKIFDLLEARPVFDLLGHEKPVTAVAFSPRNGSTIASGGKDSLVFLWQSNLKVCLSKETSETKFKHYSLVDRTPNLT